MCLKSALANSIVPFVSIKLPGHSHYDQLGTVQSFGLVSFYQSEGDIFTHRIYINLA